PGRRPSAVRTAPASRTAPSAPGDRVSATAIPCGSGRAISQGTSAQMQIELLQRRTAETQQIGERLVLANELAQLRELGAIKAINTITALGRQRLQVQFGDQCGKAGRWRGRPFQEQAVVVT